MKRLSMIVIASLLLGQAHAQKQQSDNQNSDKMDNTEQYTFQLNDKVTRQKVAFKNRYGITLTGDLYLPKNQGSEPLSMDKCFRQNK